jgi:hypothetical protein
MIQYYQIEEKPLSRALEWEKNFVDLLDGLNYDVPFYYYATRSLDDELARSIGGDIYLVAISYTLMILITTFVLAKRFNPVETR